MPRTAISSAPSLLPYKKRKDSSAGSHSNEECASIGCTSNHEGPNSCDVSSDEKLSHLSDINESTEPNNTEVDPLLSEVKSLQMRSNTQTKSSLSFSERSQWKTSRPRNNQILKQGTLEYKEVESFSGSKLQASDSHIVSQKRGDKMSEKINPDECQPSTESACHLNENRLQAGELASELNSEVDLNYFRGEFKTSFSFGEKKNQRLKVHFTCNPSEHAESDGSTTASVDSITEALRQEHTDLNRAESKDAANFRATHIIEVDKAADAKVDSFDTVEVKIAEAKLTTTPEFRLSKNIINERRLPSKKRKGSHDISFQPGIDAKNPLQHRKGSHDSTSTVDPQTKVPHEVTETCIVNLDKPNSDTKGPLEVVSSLEENSTSRLRADSTGSMVFDLILAPRNYSHENNSSGIALFAIEPPDNSSIKMHVSIRNDENSAGSFENSSQHHTSHLDISALEQLDEIKTKNILLSNRSLDKVKKADIEKSEESEDHSASNETFSSSGHRVLLEAIMLSTESACSPSDTEKTAPMIEYPVPFNPIVQSHLSGATFARRDRLESWGGMSDISLPWHSSSVLESPAGEQVVFVDDKPDASPNRTMTRGRERLDSLASLSEASFGIGAVFPLPSLTQQQNLDGTFVEINNGNDIQDFVAAAMATIGDQLAELAGAVESAANGGDLFEEKFRGDFGFDDGSNSDANVSQPIIGSCADAMSPRKNSRLRSWSASSEKLSVDYDAVHAAMEAAEAASGSLGLTDVKTIKKVVMQPAKARAIRRKLPLKRQHDIESSSSSSTCSEPDLALIRERARAAAGLYGPIKIPSSSSNTFVAKAASPPKKARKRPLPPIKKRRKKNSLSPTSQCPPWISDAGAPGTPKAPNKNFVRRDKLSVGGSADVPIAPKSSIATTKQVKQQGQSNQKWDSMFDALVEFIEQRRLEDTAQLGEKEKEAWIWDGNVPTNYKSQDGKALGRWVNNQRSAKSKGALKEDREQRLIDIGLKWSVLASNAWNLMLDELNAYIKENTQSGVKWDGNVPTNYQIKTSPDSDFAGEDKNLGRWVNRQRSMYQAGKLRKDRQLELEKIGLKWSMLATTSWDVMFDTLVEYVVRQKKDGKAWDGNVPANYRTDDDPPRSLGRWINRQRSAYTKRKLKLEYVDKLNALGLKWSIHNRHGDGDIEIDDDDDSDEESIENKIKLKPDKKQNLVAKTVKNQPSTKAKNLDETVKSSGNIPKQISTDKEQVEPTNAQNKSAHDATVSSTEKCTQSRPPSKIDNNSTTRRGKVRDECNAAPVAV